MEEIKKEFNERTKLILNHDQRRVLWRWIEEKLEEVYAKGVARGHYLGFQQAEKSIPSYQDAIDDLTEHLEEIK